MSKALMPCRQCIISNECLMRLDYTALCGRCNNHLHVIWMIAYFCSLCCQHSIFCDECDFSIPTIVASTRWDASVHQLHPITPMKLNYFAFQAHEECFINGEYNQCHCMLILLQQFHDLKLLLLYCLHLLWKYFP